MSLALHGALTVYYALVLALSGGTAVDDTPVAWPASVVVHVVVAAERELERYSRPTVAVGRTARGR